MMLFLWMFPVVKRRAYTRTGRRLRSFFGWVCVGHAFFFVFSLAIIGFFPMIENLILGFYTYSMYLTIRQCASWLYILLVFGAFCLDIWLESKNS